MDVFCRLIDMVEEIFVHERVVALRMLLRKSYILIHVERNDILERNFTGFYHSDKFGVSLDRCRTCAKTDYKWLVSNGSLLVDLLGNVMCSPDRALAYIFSDNDFHNN